MLNDHFLDYLLFQEAKEEGGKEARRYLNDDSVFSIFRKIPEVQNQYMHAHRSNQNFR